MSSIATLEVDIPMITQRSLGAIADGFGNVDVLSEIMIGVKDFFIANDKYELFIDFLKNSTTAKEYDTFICPTCGSSQFGSSTNGDGSVTRHCHGDSCCFSFHESEDYKYFHDEKEVRELHKKTLEQSVEITAQEVCLTAENWIEGKPNVRVGEDSPIVKVKFSDGRTGKGYFKNGYDRARWLTSIDGTAGEYQLFKNRAWCGLKVIAYQPLETPYEGEKK